MLFSEGFTNVNVLSSSPDLQIAPEFRTPNLKNVVINTLNDENSESNAWCARNWNTIFIKALKHHDSVMCFQDDTTFNDGFGRWLTNVTDRFDFLWGPAGDQWFYLTRSILGAVGYWDERYLSCWCGDADLVRRIYQTYDKNKLSIEDSHPWGFVHNPSGITQMINHGDVRPWRGGPHINQHQEMEVRGLDKVVLKYCIDWYYTKWGPKADMYTPIPASPAQCHVIEPDWYPWFTRDYLYRPNIGPTYQKAGGRWQDSVFYPQIKQPDGSMRELPNEVRGKDLFKLVQNSWCDNC